MQKGVDKAPLIVYNIRSIKNEEFPICTNFAISIKYGICK